MGKARRTIVELTAMLDSGRYGTLSLALVDRDVCELQRAVNATIRRSAADRVEGLTGLRDRVAELEAENERLRAERLTDE